MAHLNSYIENEVAYEAAKEANIKRNRAKTARAKWLSTPAGQRQNDFLYGFGEFEDTRNGIKVSEFDFEGWYRDTDGRDLPELKCHPIYRFAGGEFLIKLQNSVLEWGAPTAGQAAAIDRMIEKGLARVAESEKKREEAKAADRATSKHIGEIGERTFFTAKVRMTTSFDSQYGLVYIYVMDDEAGNVLVYKGSKALMHPETHERFERGSSVVLKATITEHGQRDGVAQTKISRPVVMDGTK